MKLDTFLDRKSTRLNSSHMSISYAVVCLKKKRFVGDGSNRWPAVHTLDAAHLYRLAIEAAPAGSRLHAVTDEGVPFREIAEAIGRNLDLPTVSIPPDDIAAYFEYLSWAVPLDNPTSSALTQELLGWHP